MRSSLENSPMTSFFVVNFTANFESKWNISLHLNRGRVIHEGRIGKFAIFSQWVAVVYEKGCKTGPWLLWQTNRKSHMLFRLMPKSSSLDDLEWRIRSQLQKKNKRRVFWSPIQRFSWRQTHILSAVRWASGAECSIISKISWILTQRRVTLKDVCGYLMLKKLIGHVC